MDPIIKIVIISFVFAIIGYLFGSILFAAIFARIFKKDIRKLGSTNPGATNFSRVISPQLSILVSLCDMAKCSLSVLICWIIYRYTIYPDFTPINDIVPMENNITYQYESLYTLVFLGGFFAILGHCFPVTFLIVLLFSKEHYKRAIDYKGGKGVSATVGLIIMISPWIFLIIFAVWFFTIIISRYSSLSSLLAITLSMFLILIPNLNFLYLFDNSVLYNPGLYAPRDDVAKISYEFNSDLIFGLFIIMFCSTFLVLMRHKSNIYRLLHGKESKIRKHKMN